MTHEEQKQWAQLVCTTDLDTPHIPIEDDTFTIGRARSCNLSLGDNRFLSGNHCRLTRRLDGKTWLEDTSTNGTWVNKTKLRKGQKIQISHGDEIYIVKKQGVQNVAYMFQEMSELEREKMDATLAYDSGDDDTENTEEYAFESKSEAEQDHPSVGVKRSRPEESPENQHDAKRLHTDNESKTENKANRPDVAPVIPKSPSQVPGTSKENVAGSSKSGASKGSSSKKKPQKPYERSNQIMKDMQQRLLKDQLARLCPPGMVLDPTQPAAASEAGDGQKKSAASDEAKQDESKPSSNAKTTEDPGEDTIAETLLCSICQDIFHQCISLQPCMHSFCAACYSDWMNMSQTCPTCRKSVQRINKNHIVNNLVEAYLKDHPNKKRSDKEIKEMDARNKITRDMLFPKERTRGNNFSLGNEYDEYESDEDPDYDSESESSPVIFGVNALTPFSFTSSSTPQSICRQCPGYIPPGPNNPNIGTVITLSPTDQPATTSCSSACVDVSDKPSTSTATSDPTISTDATQPKAKGDKDPTAQPKADAEDDKPSTSKNPQSTCGSTSASITCSASNTDSTSTETHQIRITPSGDVVSLPMASEFQCNIGGNHLMCLCCQQRMPDRRGITVFSNINTPTDRPQACAICKRFYCHLYWGCHKIDCLGCLNKFKDMIFGDKCMKNFVNNNTYESDILKKYLQNHGKSWQDVLRDSLTKLDAGQYNCPDRLQHAVNSNTVMCYTCGMKNFQELAYHYRKDIPRNQLPAEALRSDCHWGKNCRTQFNKPHHAQRFNHICDQTKF